MKRTIAGICAVFLAALLCAPSLAAETAEPGFLPENSAQLMASDAEIYQALYEHIVRGLEQRQSVISFSVPVTPYSVNVLILTVVNTRPDLFYFSPIVRPNYDANGNITALYPEYTHPEAASAELDRVVRDVVGQAERFTDPVRKLLFFHDYLITHCKYTSGDVSSVYKSAYDALVTGDTVCQGYAMALKLLIDTSNKTSACPIENFTITTANPPLNHIWNAVKIGDSYYHIDVTMDDFLSSSDCPDSEGYCSYKYFLISDDTLGTYHKEMGAGGAYPYDWNRGNLIGLVPCTSKTYESGWIFCESDREILQRNGKYYYLKGLTSNTVGVYEASGLTTASARKTAELYMDISCYMGTVWHDGWLYYLNVNNFGDKEAVLAYNTDTGEGVQVGQFDNVGNGFPNGCLGLRYEDGRVVVSQSLTRRDVASFPAIPAMSGSRGDRMWLSGDGTVGLIPLDAPADGAALVAFYRNGQFTGLRQGAVDSKAVYYNNLTGCPLPAYKLVSFPPGPDQGETARLFLLNAAFSPVCPAAAREPKAN